MKFKEDRPLANPEVAEQELLELANAIEADRAGRMSVAVILWGGSKPPSRMVGSSCIRPALTCRLRRRALISSRDATLRGSSK